MKTNQCITAFLAALLVGVLLMECGCGTKWQARRCRALNCGQVIKDSTRITDSTYYVPISYDIGADSGWVASYFECNDSLQVILRYSETVNGKYLRMVKDLESGKYTVYSYYPKHTDTIPGPVRVRTVYKEIIQNQPPTNILTKFQQFKCTAFWPLLIGDILFLLVLIYLVYRWIKKRFTI